MPRPKATPQQLFWKKVAHTTNHNECWNWTGSLNSKGYGNLQANKQKWLAHRYSYHLNKGTIPNSYQITHTCDNRQCVNPNHLIAGTATYNMRDMVNKGRHPEQAVTHCPKNHEYTQQNTYRQPSKPNQRQCRECRRNANKKRPPRTEYNREYWRKHKSNHPHKHRSDKSNQQPHNKKTPTPLPPQRLALPKSLSGLGVRLGPRDRDGRAGRRLV